MKVIALYLLLFAGFIILAYYLYLVFIGKSLARLVGSKDRFIWNGLKNITDKASRGRVTLFLDDTHLIISKLSLPATYSRLKSDSLDQGMAIAFGNIVEFDYTKKGLPFISSLINTILKINNYNLKLAYYDDSGEINRMTFTSSSMDPLDFEASFADFNNKIYGSSGLRRDLTGSETGRVKPTNSQDITAPLTSSNQRAEVVKSTEHTGSFADRNLGDTGSSDDKTEIIKGTSFKEDLEKQGLLKTEEQVDKTEIVKASFLKKVMDQLKKEEIEEPIKTDGSKEARSGLEDVTLVVGQDLAKHLEEDKKPSPVDLGQATQAINQEELAKGMEKLMAADPKSKPDLGYLRMDKEVEKQPQIEKIETSEEEKSSITRRSFLDKGAKKKTAKAEDDETQLPDELKKIDTTGLSQEEIDQLELERINKLKEFFTDKKND